MLATKEEWLAALTAVEERLAPIYRVRRQLREAYVERYEPALPERPRDRSPVQERVARCPRCGGRLNLSDSQL